MKLVLSVEAASIAATVATADRNVEKGGVDDLPDLGDVRGPVGIEVRDVLDALDLGDEGRRHPLGLDVLPDDVGQEGVAHDRVGVGGEPTKTPLDVKLKETLNKRPCIFRQVGGYSAMTGKKQTLINR